MDGITLTGGTGAVSGTYVWDGSGLSVGPHTVTLIARDPAGNVGQTDLLVTLLAPLQPTLPPPTSTPIPPAGNPPQGGSNATSTKNSLPTPTNTRTQAIVPFGGSAQGTATANGGSQSSSLPPSPTATRSNAVVPFGGVGELPAPDSISPASASPAAGSSPLPGALFGAEAAAAIAAATAYALSQQRKRKEEEAAEAAAATAYNANQQALEQQRAYEAYLKAEEARKRLKALTTDSPVPTYQSPTPPSPYVPPVAPTGYYQGPPADAYDQVKKYQEYLKKNWKYDPANPPTQEQLGNTPYYFGPPTNAGDMVDAWLAQQQADADAAATAEAEANKPWWEKAADWANTNIFQPVYAGFASVAHPVADFLEGAIYQWVMNNADALAMLNPFPGRDNYFFARQQLDNRMPDSLAFNLGQLLGDFVGIVQCVLETPSGIATMTGGTVISCGTVVLCIEGGGASIAIGGALVIDGVSVGVASAADAGSRLFKLSRGNNDSSGEGKPSDQSQNSRAEAEKINHIFGDPKHHLDALVDHYGSEEAAYEALRIAAQEAVDSQGLNGIFEVIVNVGGYQVTVRGTVIDGIVRIGTAFIP